MGERSNIKHINQFSIIMMQLKNLGRLYIAILCILSLILISCAKEEEDKEEDKEQLNQTQPDARLLDNTFTISATPLPPQVNISSQQDIIVELNLTSDMLLADEHTNKPLNLSISGMNYNLKSDEQDYACSPTIQASQSSINAPAREDNSRLFSFNISQVLLADREDECGNVPQIRGLAQPPFDKISQVQLTAIMFTLNNTARQLGQLNIDGETTITGDVLILVSCTEEEDGEQLNQTQPCEEQLNQTQSNGGGPDGGLPANTFTISATALPAQVNISRQQDISVQLNLTSPMLLADEHINKSLNLNISGMNYNLHRDEQDYACSPAIQASQRSINAPAREDNSRLFSFNISQVLLADRNDECGNGPQIEGLAQPPFEKISQVQLTDLRFVLNNTTQQHGQLSISGETTIIGDVIKRPPVILSATTGPFFINNNTPMGTIVGNISALFADSYSIVSLDGGGMIDNINLNSPINFNNQNGLITASDNLTRGEYMYTVTAHNEFFNASRDFSVRVWTDDEKVSVPTSTQQISVYEGTIGKIGNVTARNAIDYQVQNIAGISTAKLFIIDNEGNISVTELLERDRDGAHQSNYSLLINASNQFSYATFPLTINITNILSEIDFNFSSRITKPTTITIINSVYSAAYNVSYIEEYDSSNNLLSIDDNGSIILSDAVNDAQRQNYALRFREIITSKDGSIKYYDENNGTLQLANIKLGNTETTVKNNYVNWWLYDDLNATDSANSTNIASMPNINLGDELVIRYPYINQTFNSRFSRVKQVNQATAESCSLSGDDNDDGSDKKVLGSYFNGENQKTASIPLRTPSGMLADANAFVAGGTYYIYSVNTISDDRSTKTTAFTDTTTDGLCQRGLRIKWTIHPSTP